MNAVIQLCGFSPCPDIGLEPYMHPLPSGGALRVWLCREHAAQLWSIASVVAPLPSDEALGLLRELDAHYVKTEAVAAQGFAAALESVTSGELKRENADIRARIRALVERTSQGGQT